VGIGPTEISTISQVAGGNLEKSGAIPWPLPASKIENAAQQVRGKTPDQVSVDLERRAGVARRMVDPRSVIGIDELGNGSHPYRRNLSRINHPNGTALPPPRHDAGDIEAANCDVDRRQRAQNVDTCSINVSFLDGFAQRGIGKIHVTVVPSTPGKGDLAGVLPQGCGALHKHQLKTAPGATDQDQHRCLPSPIALSRPQSREGGEPVPLTERGDQCVQR
jgi:hypothetical protein